MSTLAETKTEFNNWISEDATVSFLEKAQAGKTTLEDIADALDEFKRLHDAGLSSPAEIITLARAYPTNKIYTEAADGLDEDEDTKPMVVGGPASVELVDREGHLITTNALKRAFKKFMKNFRARNVMVMHSDVQVGHALPAYISKSGNIFKSGVDDNGLFFISELRGDTKISKRVRDQIEKGGMSSYSIAGSATKSKDIKKSDGNSVLQVDDMELAEVTICEKGVNQGAHFELLKGDKAEGSCADGSCMTKHSEPAPTTPTVRTEYVAISKEDINSIDMFNNWISKAAPMMAGATAKLPKTTASPTAAANVTGGIGMPVKMSMEKKAADDRLSQGSAFGASIDSARQKARARKSKYGIDDDYGSRIKKNREVNPYAIATAMAKKKGFKNFSEDSKGDKYRDKITEGIKETNNMKKEFLSKDSERMPAQSGKRRTFGDLSKPKAARTRQSDTGPDEYGNPNKFIVSPPKSGKPRGKKQLRGIGAAARARKATPPTARSLGTRTKESIAKLGGKVLSQAGLGRSGKGRGTIGATKRAIGAITRGKPSTGPSRRPTPKSGGKPSKPRGRAYMPSLRAKPPTGARRIPTPKSGGKPTRLGDIPKGTPSRLGKPKVGASAIGANRMTENAIQKGDTMDIRNIIKEAFNEVFMKDNGDTGVLAPVKRPTRQPKLSAKDKAYEQRIAALERDAAKETPDEKISRQLAEASAARGKKQERDKRAKTQRQLLTSLNAPRPSEADLKGPKAERQQMAARKRKFAAPEPVGMPTRSEFDPETGVLSKPQDYESERKAARKNLPAIQDAYARSKERSKSGKGRVTGKYDPASPAGSPSAPPKKTSSTTTVSKPEAKPLFKPKKVAGSGREEQQMRRTGTTRPTTTSTPTKKKFKPTKTGGKIGGQSANPESGRVKVTPKKPSAPKTKAPTRRGFATAAAAIMANRKEIAARTASKKLTSGSADRVTETQG